MVVIASSDQERPVLLVDDHARNANGVLIARSIHGDKKAGYPPKMLQEIMVHASITTTLDLYGHLYPGDMDRYADRLDDAADEAGKAKTRPDDDEDNTAA